MDKFEMFNHVKIAEKLAKEYVQFRPPSETWVPCIICIEKFNKKSPCINCIRTNSPWKEEFLNRVYPPLKNENNYKIKIKANR